MTSRLNVQRTLHTTKKALLASGKKSTTKDEKWVHLILTSHANKYAIFFLICVSLDLETVFYLFLPSFKSSFTKMINGHLDVCIL